MAKKPRCKECEHPRGLRRLGPLAKVPDGVDPRTKKAPCGCDCHD